MHSNPRASLGCDINTCDNNSINLYRKSPLVVSDDVYEILDYKEMREIYMSGQPLSLKESKNNNMQIIKNKIIV